MLTLERRATPLALCERRPVQPTLLGGLLFASLEIVPLSAEGPVTPARVAGIAGLLAVAVALVRHGVPRSRQRPLPSGAAARLELDGDALPPTYRATLVLADGTRHLVLERGEPAGLLDDAAHLARALGVPLGGGFGLGESALGSLLASSGPNATETHFEPDAKFNFEHPPLAGQRAAAYTTLWAAAFVLVASFVMANGPEHHGLVPSALSLTLPVLSVIALLVIGFWLLGLRERVVLSASAVTRQRWWFGRELASPQTQTVTVSAAALVSPASGKAGHLLLASRAGLFAVPLELPDGARVLEYGSPPAPAREHAAE